MTEKELWSVLKLDLCALRENMKENFPINTEM